MSKKFLLAITASVAISLTCAPVVSAAENITYNVESPISAETLNTRIKGAMSRGEDRISVNLTPGSGNIPLSLVEWISRVKNSQGQVFVKDTSKGWGDWLKILIKKSIEAIEEIITGTTPASTGDSSASIASGAIVDGLLDPAKKYNALLVSETKDSRTCWKKVEFYKRGSAAWTQAIADAKDINDTDLDYVGAGAETVSACAT